MGVDAVVSFYTEKNMYPLISLKVPDLFSF